MDRLYIGHPRHATVSGIGRIFVWGRDMGLVGSRGGALMILLSDFYDLVGLSENVTNNAPSAYP